jgi:hypothetical protein
MLLAQAHEPVDRFSAVFVAALRSRFGRLERLHDDILSILKAAALKTLFDERLDFGVPSQTQQAFVIP